MLITLAPALYCAHAPTALDQLSALPETEREIAYACICEFILDRQLPSDPYDYWHGQGYNLSYEDIVELCNLMDLMRHDGRIYRFIEVIADSVVASRQRSRFSVQQISDVVQRLSIIAKTKFPDQRNIQHDGYRILALAQCLRLRNPVTRATAAEWTEIIESARAIPNVADRAFVLCLVAEAMPARDSGRRKELLQEAHAVTSGIPTIRDRIDRLTTLASYSADIEPSLPKQCLSSAMSLATGATGQDLRDLQRDIIDLAHRLDPDLAASLASLSDDDPARVGNRQDLRDRLKVLDLRKSIVDAAPVGDALTPQSRTDYARAAWMLLGSLNSGRAEALHLDRTRHVPQLAAMMPVSDSYPLLAWMIENAARRLGTADQTATFIRPIFEATLIGTELAAHLASRAALSLRQAKDHALSRLDGDAVIVRSGDREAALQFLRDWFESCVEEYLKICDPYFGPEELTILQVLASAKPECKVQILTSSRHQEQLGIQKPWDEAYRRHWRLRVSQQDPPDTEVVIVGMESAGKPPIHDRWCLTLGGGIHLGTSLNSLGLTQTSAISILPAEDAAAIESEVDRYLRRRERTHRGERLQYTLFTL